MSYVPDYIGKDGHNRITPPGMDPALMDIVTQHADKVVATVVAYDKRMASGKPYDQTLPANKKKIEGLEIQKTRLRIAKAHRTKNKIPRGPFLYGEPGQLRAAEARRAVKNSIGLDGKIYKKEKANGHSGYEMVDSNYEGALITNDDRGRIQAEPPGTKIGERSVQLLGWLSTALFAFIKTKTNTVEVEAMIVNNRIFVSANEQAAVTQMCAQCLSDTLNGVANSSFDIADSSGRPMNIAEVAQALKIIPKGSVPTATQLKGAHTIAKLEAEAYQDEDQAELLRQILTVLQSAMQNRTAIYGPVDGDGAARALIDGTLAQRVIAVNGLGTPTKSCSHAEQNLVYALAKADYYGPAAVAGTKRPCLTCWLTLKLAQKHGLSIDFKDAAGAFWDSSTFKGLHRVADLWGLDYKHLRAELYEIGGVDNDMFTQWVTNMDKSRDEDDFQVVEVVDVREEPDLSTVRTQLSQTFSPPSSPPYSPPHTPDQKLDD
jgi:hypothetical protein